MPKIRKVKDLARKEVKRRGRPKGSKNKPVIVEEGYTFRCTCGKTALSPHNKSIMLCKHGDEYKEMICVN